MKFDICNRYTGKVQFTAEIDCKPNASFGDKMGFAIMWAVANGADLSDAIIPRANLAGANLTGAHLPRAVLFGANLDGANLFGANLAGAYLSGAYLSGANLSRANLSGAKLAGAHGVNKYIKSMHIDGYSIAYTADVLQIWCENHTISDWRGFDDKRIFQMEGAAALKFWRKHKDLIFQTIELCPAEPTMEEME